MADLIERDGSLSERDDQLLAPLEEIKGSFEDNLNTLIAALFEPQGYLLNGTIRWKGESQGDKGTLNVMANQMELVADEQEPLGEEGIQEIMSLLRSRKPGQISLAVEIMMDVMKGEPIAGTVDVLCNHLCDRDLGVRLTAAQCLTEFGAHSEPAIPALITALKDPHEWVRAEAAAALAAIGPKAAAAIPALEQLRNDPCYGPCGRAQEALEAIRMSAKSAVRAQIDSQ